MTHSGRNSQSYSRFDVGSAVIVEKGIALQHIAGTAYAARFLQSERIGAAVILRVLLRPAQRRLYRSRQASHSYSPMSIED